MDRFYKYLPINTKINWDIIEKELLLPYVDKLKSTMQEDKWHGEGDVYTHTKMVCDELIKLEEYNSLNKDYQLVLFLSALFHDIGKIVCTKVIDGQIRSFHHPKKGSNMIREYLWKELKLSGTKQLQEFREAICLLVRYHSEPTYFNYEKNKEKKVIELSLNTNLTKYFNNQMLSLLALADIRGRISDDNDLKEGYVLEYILYAKELNCYNESFKFKNTYTKIKYLNSNSIWHQQELYDSSWGEVILLCGLPGTGKDTYINTYYPNTPVISLDDIRAKLKIKPNDNQGEVYNIAKDMAKSYLREKKTFIWNATNISEMIREKQIKLFHEYGAKVKIIFLETSLEENLKRNKERKKVVIESVIFDMLGNLTLPLDTEAEEVIWLCI